MKNNTTALALIKPQPIYFGVDFASANIHCSAQSGSGIRMVRPAKIEPSTKANRINAMIRMLNAGTICVRDNTAVVEEMKRYRRNSFPNGEGTQH